MKKGFRHGRRANRFSHGSAAAQDIGPLLLGGVRRLFVRRILHEAEKKYFMRIKLRTRRLALLARSISPVLR
ncbi:MAG: hypothetical protein EOS23_30815 [Mesorhizobium sp.]|nr:MAG: hypothetical protein EOQ56_33980 [Mesorhizobium sp.]RWE06509.1 MAG: hypothetical protein EOS23_30815 [Mesorhizobium sp.]